MKIVATLTAKEIATAIVVALEEQYPNVTEDDISLFEVNGEIRADVDVETEAPASNKRTCKAPVEDTEEEEAKPVSRRTRKPKVEEPAEDPEDDADNDDSDYEAEEEEEVKPARSRRRNRKPEPVDDVADEEEEEQPRRKKVMFGRNRG